MLENIVFNQEDTVSVKTKTSLLKSQFLSQMCLNYEIKVKTKKIFDLV